MLVTMTDKDLYRLGIIQRVHDHTLLQREAAGLLELSVCQIQRILRRYRENGAASPATIGCLLALLNVRFRSSASTSQTLVRRLPARS